MVSDMSKFLISMFEGNMDFTVWKMTIEDVLVQQGIDEALEENQPKEMKDNVWKTMQKKASSTIRLALVPEIKYSVLKEIRKDILDKLTNIYASKALKHRFFWKMELYSLNLEEGSNLHHHINSFNQLVCQLANVDDAIKDEEQALLMLSSLQKSYKSFRMTGNDSSSISDKLLVAYDSERGRNFHRGSSKGRSKSRMGGDRDMSVSLRDSKGKIKVEDVYMNVVDNGGDEFLMTETPMDGILIEEKPNKHMMKIEGVGSVRFKLHDESVKTALNVKYVPGAARNILSHGVLTSRGYRYVGRKDTFWLQISHGEAAMLATFRTKRWFYDAGLTIAKSGCWSMLKGGLTVNESGEPYSIFRAKMRQLIYGSIAFRYNPSHKESGSFIGVKALRRCKNDVVLRPNYFPSLSFPLKLDPESEDTPLVFPFLDSDEESDDSEVEEVDIDVRWDDCSRISLRNLDTAFPTEPIGPNVSSNSAWKRYSSRASGMVLYAI
ncbi:hypothetical protein Tco_0487866 [Tanacetum coccineum]